MVILERDVAVRLAQTQLMRCVLLASSLIVAVACGPKNKRFNPQIGSEGGGGSRLSAVCRLVFVGVHAKYRETPTIIMSCVLGLLMAFIAYRRMILSPIF